MPTSGGLDRNNGKAAIYGATLVTDGAGNVTFAFPAGLFTAWPIIAVARQGPASSTVYDFSITALSATSVTINVRKAVPVTVLTISVLAANVVAPGETIHMMAQVAG